MKPEDRSHFPDRFPESTLVLPFITVIQGSPAAPTPKQCRSSPEREAGTSFERIAGAAVQREPQTTASYDSCAPKIPSAFRLTRHWHPTQGRDTLDRDNHSPLNGCKPRLPHKRSHVDGTIPQTGVLMVTHERNMRSKFR